MAQAAEPALEASACAQSPVLVLSSRGEALLEVRMHLRRGRLQLRLPAAKRGAMSTGSSAQLLSKVSCLRRCQTSALLSFQPAERQVWISRSARAGCLELGVIPCFSCLTRRRCQSIMPSSGGGQARISTARCPEGAIGRAWRQGAARQPAPGAVP